MRKREVFGFRTSEEIKIQDGKTVPPGTPLIRGISCPKCKRFYPFAARLNACNECGWKAEKGMDRTEVKKKLKELKRAGQLIPATNG